MVEFGRAYQFQDDVGVPSLPVALSLQLSRALCASRNNRRLNCREMRAQGVASNPGPPTLEAQRREGFVDREIYTRTISSLVDYYEGYETLALILNVKVEELQRWAGGKSRPPADVFFRIIDLARRPGGTLRLVN